MADLALIKAELAVYGIHVFDDGRCEVALGAERKPTTVPAEMQALTNAIKANKQFLRQLWRELSELIVSGINASTPGNDSTQRVFASALVWLHELSERFQQLARERHFLGAMLKQDVYHFPEAFMGKIIQYRVCIDWMDQIIKIDQYKLKLIKTTASAAHVTAQSGPWTGGIDLRMDERVYDASDNAADEDKIRDGRKLMAPFDKENMLPDTYNKPDEFEPGFYYRDRNQEPYAFDDEDDNPYPHRNILWQ